jgi:hypothetical protein
MVQDVKNSSRVDLPSDEDFIRASVGFRCIEMMKSHLKQLYQDTIIIDTLPADAVLDQGELPI